MTLTINERETKLIREKIKIFFSVEYVNRILKKKKLEYIKQKLKWKEFVKRKQ